MAVTTGKKAAVSWTVCLVGLIFNQVSPIVRLSPLSAEQRWWLVWVTFTGLVMLVVGGVAGLVYWNRLMKEWTKR